jgi:hypothetical protein
MGSRHALLSEEVRHWQYPLLRLDYVQSDVGCRLTIVPVVIIEINFVGNDVDHVRLFQF